MNKRLLPFKILNGSLSENDNITYNEKEIGKALISNKYNFGLVKLNNDIYRSFDGGIVMLDNELNFINDTKIGNEEPGQVYSSEIINEKVYFGITNFTDINLVKIYNSNNELESTIEVGLFPGDFAYWEEQQ